LLFLTFQKNQENNRTHVNEPAIKREVGERHEYEETTAFDTSFFVVEETIKQITEIGGLERNTHYRKNINRERNKTEKWIKTHKYSVNQQMQ